MPQRYNRGGWHSHRTATRYGPVDRNLLSLALRDAPSVLVKFWEHITGLDLTRPPKVGVGKRALKDGDWYLMPHSGEVYVVRGDLCWGTGRWGNWRLQLLDSKKIKRKTKHTTIKFLNDSKAVYLGNVHKMALYVGDPGQDYLSYREAVVYA